MTKKKNDDYIYGTVEPEVLAELDKIEKLVEQDVFDEIKGRVIAEEPEKRMKLLWKISDDLYKADLCDVDPCDEMDEPMTEEEFDKWAKSIPKKE